MCAPVVACIFLRWYNFGSSILILLMTQNYTISPESACYNRVHTSKKFRKLFLCLISISAVQQDKKHWKRPSRQRANPFVSFLSVWTSFSKKPHRKMSFLRQSNTSKTVCRIKKNSGNHLLYVLKLDTRFQMNQRTLKMTEYIGKFCRNSVLNVYHQ